MQHHPQNQLGTNGLIPPETATAVIVLEDGDILWGHGFGKSGTCVGELCFNTGMTGYQESLTDTSYAGQILVFTFPHIGNVGTNLDDCESHAPSCRGLVLSQKPTPPSNYRSEQDLCDWASEQGLRGIWGVDVRRLTRRLRDDGAANAVLCVSESGDFDIPTLLDTAQKWPGIEGADLARDVSIAKTELWDSGGVWGSENGYECLKAKHEGLPKIVAIDFGAKRNIMRALASVGCEVYIVPAQTSAQDIMALEPNGVFLSNGPGDPEATGVYAAKTLQTLMGYDVPIFGICLGHQILALALGGKTEKMHHGHHGANHPVQVLESGAVEITSQNHGFQVKDGSLPSTVEITHRSLFDGSIEGLRVKGSPIFSVQHHPEASPGPGDSSHMFNEFVTLVNGHREKHL